MGFKVGKDVSPMERELIYLLADLCVKWGFCISQENIEKISKKKFYKAEDFAIDIITAEGMELGSKWKRLISERFVERFGKYQINSETFGDRVRGITENWET